MAGFPFFTWHKKCSKKLKLSSYLIILYVLLCKLIILCSLLWKWKYFQAHVYALNQQGEPDDFLSELSAPPLTHVSNDIYRLYY